MRNLSLLLLGVLLAAPAHAESFESLSIKAEKAAKAKRGDAALDDYARALSLWQEEDGKAAKAKILAARAALYENRGRHEQAKADLSEAIDLSRKHAPYFAARGHAELELGERALAITDLYRATALDLGLREAYLDRGLAYAEQGDLRFAAEDYRTACKLGLKKGCARAAALKERGARAKRPQRPSGEEFEAMKPAADMGYVDIRHGPAPLRKLDLKRCRAALDDCIESGLSFGECVAKDRSCPVACRKAFDRLASGASEASAFRTVFEMEDCSGERE